MVILVKKVNNYDYDYEKKIVYYSDVKPDTMTRGT